MNAIIFSAVLICGILYTPVGFFGYLAFGENECGDVLNKFFSKNVAAGIGRIVVMITVTISYPLNNFPARQALAGWITGDSKKEVSTPVFIFLTLFLFALNLVIAIFVKNINIVFSLAGSTLAVLIIFIFPAVCTWKINKESKDPFVLIKTKIEAVLLITLGIIIAICGTYLTIKGIISGSTSC